MNHYFKEIEAALLPAASQYTPEGTEPKALVHQWIHALAYGFTPFAAVRGVIAKKTIFILKRAQFNTDATSSKSLIRACHVRESVI